MEEDGDGSHLNFGIGGSEGNDGWRPGFSIWYGDELIEWLGTFLLLIPFTVAHHSQVKPGLKPYKHPVRNP